MNTQEPKIRITKLFTSSTVAPVLVKSTNELELNLYYFMNNLDKFVYWTIQGFNNLENLDPKRIPATHFAHYTWHESIRTVQFSTFLVTNFDQFKGRTIKYVFKLGEEESDPVKAKLQKYQKSHSSDLDCVPLFGLTSSDYSIPNRVKRSYTLGTPGPYGGMIKTPFNRKLM